jgi:hypothetical protein
MIPFWLLKMCTGERTGRMPSEGVSTCIVEKESKRFGSGRTTVERMGNGYG